MRTRLSHLQEQFREKDDQLLEKEGINLHLQTLLNTKKQQLEKKLDKKRIPKTASSRRADFTISSTTKGERVGKGQLVKEKRSP